MFCIVSTGCAAAAPSLSVTRPWRSASCGCAMNGRLLLSSCRQDVESGEAQQQGAGHSGSSEGRLPCRSRSALSNLCCSLYDAP